MKDSDRARVAAMTAYRECKTDPARSGLAIKAVEVRMESAGPDVSFHQYSGSRTQGGFLFFASDLDKEL